MEEIGFDEIIKVIEGGRITLPKDYREKNGIERGTRSGAINTGREKEIISCTPKLPKSWRSQYLNCTVTKRNA